MTSRSKEENREYMRDYMRERRKTTRKRNREADLARKRAEYKSEAPDIWSKSDFVSRDRALYDPLRDAPLRHSDLVEQMNVYRPASNVRAGSDADAVSVDVERYAPVRSISLAGAQS